MGYVMLKELVNLKRERLLDKRYVDLSRNYITALEGNIDEIPIDGQVARKYRGDFFGLLNTLNVPVELYQVTLDLNDMDSSDDYLGNGGKIKVVNETYIKDILSL